MTPRFLTVCRLPWESANQDALPSALATNNYIIISFPFRRAEAINMSSGVLPLSVSCMLREINSAVHAKEGMEIRDIFRYYFLIIRR
ncbi:unnamed protein product, partial [Nesidiocoris tenuis]